MLSVHFHMFSGCYYIFSNCFLFFLPVTHFSSVIILFRLFPYYFASVSTLFWIILSHFYVHYILFPNSTYIFWLFPHILDISFFSAGFSISSALFKLLNDFRSDSYFCTVPQFFCPFPNVYHCDAYNTAFFWFIGLNLI